MMLTDVRVLLEGVEIPVRSCSVSNSVQMGAQAQIGVISRSSLLTVTPFSHVDIYYRYHQTWLCVFQGLFVALSPSSAASNQEYTIRAVSQEWQLDRIKLATMVLGTSPTDAYLLNMQYQISGTTGKVATNSQFLNLITDPMVVAISKVSSDAVNDFSIKFIEALLKRFTDSALGDLYKKYFLRIGLEGCMSTFKLNVEEFFKSIKLETMLDKAEALMGNASTAADFIKYFKMRLFYDSVVNLFPSNYNDKLIYYHIRPMAPSCNIPACNILPPVQTFLNFSKDYSRVPTRASMIVPSILDKEKHVSPVINTDITGTISEKNCSTKVSLDEINNYGILYVTLTSNFDKPITLREDITDNVEIARNEAQIKLWQLRHSPMAMNASFPLMPQLLCGLPATILSHDTMYIGTITSIQHNFNANATTIGLQFVQEITDIEIAPKAPWVSPDYVDDTDAYFKYMGTSTGVKMYDANLKDQILNYYQNNYIGKTEEQIFDTAMGTRAFTTDEQVKVADKRTQDPDRRATVQKYRDDVDYKVSYAGSLPFKED